ncbi:tRNA methyltransferase 10 homolog C [Archocentrus centrarchus]|uniref:tRNA methyltransferase 10 homolog C n=1 Tax=Archocentrus centrarchus TaxID=63155 RepID=UPI0011E9EA56|nr:tRNA methyltransferase 10 homolog C [Archocentrus centrarchus]
MLLRLFTARGCAVFWKCAHSVASCASKRQVGSFLPNDRASRRGVSLPVCLRLFSTVSPAGKDAPQTKSDKSQETETLDLDRWKSVMRSQAAFNEKHVKDEVEEQDDDDDENLKEAGNDLKDGSSLEATRDLVAMWRQAGKLVPEEMTDEEVKTLAKLTTKSSRKKYLKYLAVREGHKKARKEKQQQKKAAREASLMEKRELEGSGEEGSGEGGHKLKNTLFFQFWDRSLDKLLAWKTAQSMVFGQPLMFDMSYESHMSRREIENTVSQLMEVEGLNRRAADPYHLHFCNLQPDGPYMKELLQRYGAEMWERLLITSTDRQHVDLFPREQLVYLTADSPNVLRTFDHSKVYIIGALVDRSIQTGLSLANAKRLKLATARLPLDEFLHWEMGAKNLTLDQMIRIMLTLKDTGKWVEALQFVPKRKHDGFHQQTETTRNKGRDHAPRDEGNRPLSSGERRARNTLKSKEHRESGFTGRGSTPAGTKVRPSLRSDIEARKSAGRNKWWHEE